jgi:hypothetical protein
MKYKLKTGKSVDDIPNNSGIHKQVKRAFASGSDVDLVILPKGIDEFIEEVVTPTVKPKIQKGVK